MKFYPFPALYVGASFRYCCRFNRTDTVDHRVADFSSSIMRSRQFVRHTILAIMMVKLTECESDPLL